MENSAVGLPYIAGSPGEKSGLESPLVAALVICAAGKIKQHKKSAHRALFLYLSDFNQNALLYFAMIAAARVRLEKKVLILFIMNSCFELVE